MVCIQAQALLQLQKAVTRNSKVSDNSFLILDFVLLCPFPAHKCILVVVFKTHLLWLCVVWKWDSYSVRPMLLPRKVNTQTGTLGYPPDRKRKSCVNLSYFMVSLQHY